MTKNAIFNLEQIPKPYTGTTKGAKLWSEVKKYKVVYLLMLPAVACFVIFSYLPMAGIVMAFNEYKIGRGFAAIFTSPWVGLDHFKRLFGSVFFYRVFANTVIINVLKLIFVFPAPILLAILLNEVRSTHFKKVVQTVSYLPNFLSAVVVYGLVLSFLSPTYGLLNAILYQFGLQPVHYLAQPQYFRSILVILDVWRYTGWDAIIYLAAITSIEQELYEAAYIDGANKFKRIWHITLPSISEVILLMFILRIGYILSADFETVFLLYSPPVYSVGDIIDTFVYREGLVNSEYSFTTAVGFFKSTVGLVLIIAVNKFAKRFGKTGIW